MSGLAYIVASAIGALVIVAGLVAMAGGVLGMLRFPDFYTRVHAANLSDVAGAALVAIGLAIVSGDAGMAIRLCMLAALFIALGPTHGQLASNAAHAGGLAPLAGAYTAPRPGARHGASR